MWNHRRAWETHRGNELPTFHYLVPYLVLPVPFRFGFRLFVLFSIAQYCEILSYFSLFLPPWESRFPPSLLPPAVDFQPPLLTGYRRALPPPPPPPPLPNLQLALIWLKGSMFALIS